MSESLPITPVTPEFGVAPQLTPADMAALAVAGYKSVINNRPDGEGGPDQPLSADLEAAARAAGLEYRHQPVNGANIQPQDIATFGGLLKELPAPVLAFCRTGTRSGILYRGATGQ